MEEILKELEVEGSDINEHLRVLYNLVVKGGYKECMELGVGRSTFAHLAGVEKTGGKLTSIDKAGYGAFMSRGGKYVHELPRDWEFIEGDSVSISREVDYLFIDTDHTYETTMRELKHWYPLVRYMIVMHDIVPAKSEFKVREALEDYLKGKDVDVEYLENNNGLAIIKKHGTSSAV